ncbi:hypothetical protein D2T29_13945 [Sinirhodobacter populi]|uniref:Uncharacterized protein n=1 Tax=Paenirhodobacter populi TaxID=2306993 RepID=A0A443KAT1_9RHOB|nr:hypothetical protein D2T29_13945 [Sinirhodobacter populi]
MRGTDEVSGSLSSYVDLEARIPARHPLRKIRQVSRAGEWVAPGENITWGTKFSGMGKPIRVPRVIGDLTGTDLANDIRP